MLIKRYADPMENVWNPFVMVSSNPTEANIAGSSTEISIANSSNEESNFASAFRHAAVGMALVSLEGRFLQVNQALCDLMGYSEEELVKLDFQTITYPADLNADLELLHQLMVGEIASYRMEKRYRHKVGVLIWGLLSVSLVYDAHGRPHHFISQIQDINERKRFEAELIASQNQMQALVENVPDIIARYDTKLRLQYASPALDRILRRPTFPLIGKTLEESNIPPSICTVHRQVFKRVLATRQSAVGEYEYQTALEKLYFQMRMVPEFEADGSIVSVLAVSHDVTAIKQTQLELLDVQKQLQAANAALEKQNDDLESLAFLDPLTRLKNRRAFDDQLTQLIAQAARHGSEFSIAFLDVDYFKSFNDRFGHAVGDEVLREVANLLEVTMRPTDIVARYGGEEFVCLMPHTDEVGAMQAAERCRIAIEAFSWAYAPVTISVGVATWADEDARTLLVRADLALYAAKQGGRNCVHQATPSGS